MFATIHYTNCSRYLIAFLSLGRFTSVLARKTMYYFPLLIMIQSQNNICHQSDSQNS